MRKVLIESLAMNFHDTIRGIVSALVDCGVPITEETMKTVEDTLFGHFDQLAMDIQNNQKSSEGEVDDNLKQLLRAAVNIKLKIDVDQKGSIAAQSPAIAALQSNEEMPEKRDNRIKYTAADILGLDKKENDGEGRKHKGSTFGNENEPAAGQAKAKPKGLASSRWAKPPDEPDFAFWRPGSGLVHLGKKTR
ncbi:hypothetical protein ESCO_003489 [Escovopsis weberi]|uniref:Uncharacterized protein n=1 Tax=Escovopsis weberi TaxID=150374 RepID=A0A0M9VXC6_ESCWE|nr:hypothetical protein ESCO_003489 [Escovopsis weberi]